MGKKKNKTLDDIAWQWTEKLDSNISKEEVKSSYRLLLPKCKNCKKNATGNPCCFHGLGESWWAKSSIASNKNFQTVQNEFEKERRTKGELVGLQNLGATCYVNTYLQLWFHNLEFRKSIYKLKEQDVCDIDTPQTICGQLQLMFGLLQSGFAKSVDPTSFIKCLNLPVDLQQDAQEFSKLFMCLLETIPGLSQVIQNQFSGKYGYVTKCLKCLSVVETPSMFYELDLNIQGHKNLRSCIMEFLKLEQLQNDNQYFCDKCFSKQDATRQIILKKLPNTLSIQLLRFVYDRTSQQKHKINTNLSFPEKLDFSDFVSEKDSEIHSLEYHLSAVLLHRGLSAYSGHFIAHILDQTTNCWYKFNDEVVEKIKSGKKLDLDTNSKNNDDIFSEINDVLQEPLPKKTKTTKGNYSSKDVYMIVYSTKSGVNQDDIKLPEHIRRYVEKENRKFEENLSKNSETLKIEQKAKLKQEADVQKFLELLSSETDDREWVPTVNIKNFLQNGKLIVFERNLKNLFCLHGNLSIHALNFLKYVPTASADILYASNSEAIRLLCTMCDQCVYNRCVFLQERRKLKSDCMLMSKAIKSFEGNAMSENKECFYVGRLSLRKWKHFILKNLHKMYPTKSIGQCEEDHDLASSQSDVEEKFVFNSELLCHHKNLKTDLDNAQIVPQFVWEILLRYFPSTESFRLGECVQCVECVNDNEKTNKDLKLLREKANKQKNFLNQLYLKKNRPVMFFDEALERKTCPNEKLFVVNGEFIEKWRSFVRHPSKNNEVFQVENKAFLCPHQLLIYDLPYFSVSSGQLNENNLQPKCVLVWEKEWDFIMKEFSVDYTICIQRQIVTPCSVFIKKIDPILVSQEIGKTENKANESVDGNSANSPNPSVIIHSEPPDGNFIKNSNTKLTVIPEVCFECVKKLADKEEEKLRVYKDADIYVTKSTKTVVEMLESSCHGVTENSLSPSSASRQSTRVRRRIRGGKKLSNISSEMTLKQLKVKLMDLFSVPPFDQNIWMDGKFLTDNSATIGSLNITPGCNLTLVEDTPDPNAMPFVFETNTPEPEVGFLGTSLLGNLGT